MLCFSKEPTYNFFDFVVPGSAAGHAPRMFTQEILISENCKEHIHLDLLLTIFENLTKHLFDNWAAESPHTCIAIQQLRCMYELIPHLDMFNDSQSLVELNLDITQSHHSGICHESKD